MGNAVQIKALFFSLIRGSPGAEIVFLNQDLAICPRSVFRDFYAHLLGPFTRRLLDFVHETRDCLGLIEFHDEMLDGGHVRQAGGDSRLKEAEAPRVQRRWWKANRRSMRWQGARSTAWRIVLRPQRRYQALRLWRTAARLRGLTAALRPSFWHPCRSTAQWIA
jgi:hypothetical protein